MAEWSKAPRSGRGFVYEARVQIPLDATRGSFFYFLFVIHAGRLQDATDVARLLPRIVADGPPVLRAWTGEEGPVGTPVVGLRRQTKGCEYS